MRAVTKPSHFPRGRIVAVHRARHPFPATSSHVSHDVRRRQSQQRRFSASRRGSQALGGVIACGSSDRQAPPPSPRSCPFRSNRN